LDKTRAQTLPEQEKVFTQYSVPKVLAKFILPAALSQLTFLILNLADAFFVGRTGDTFQISAMTITFPIVMILTCIGTIFGVGANANMASELGKGNRERAKNFSAFAVYAAGGIIALLSFILLAVKEPLLLMCMNICDFVRNYYFNIFGGQVELAAWGVVQKIGNAFMQICVGIAQGIRPVVSYNYACGLQKRVRSIINGGIAVMGVWVLLCQALVAAMPTLIVNLLIPSGESVPVAVSYLRIWIFCIIGFGFIKLFNAAFQSIGRWKI